MTRASPARSCGNKDLQWRRYGSKTPGSGRRLRRNESILNVTQPQIINISRYSLLTLPLEEAVS